MIKCVEVGRCNCSGGISVCVQLNERVHNHSVLEWCAAVGVVSQCVAGCRSVLQ